MLRMYFKIAINNIKKSFKDYAIYFITLTLAVCIFYNFNSINSQTAMNQINKIESVLKFISYISVFMSIVFGGLVLYANSALLKKRKKEFGIYAVLGMSKRKISQILIYETFVVAFISLIIGIVGGVLLSQGISVLTGKLFEIDMSQYRFVISAKAISKTFLYFGIMFILVMIFNTLVVSKQKLIDMINASKKNEYITLRSPMISVIIFILSLFVLGRGYYLAWKFAPTPKNINFPYSIIWGSLGTLLFFFGLSGFILLILRKSKKIYLKKLNIFVIKQFNNKINTNFVSMAVICLMLTLTIGILSMSLNMKYESEKTLKNLMPFDAEIELSISEDNQKVKDIKEALNILGFQLNNSYEYAILDFYWTNIKTSDLLNQYANKELKDTLSYRGYLSAMKLSQYNEVRKLKGEDRVNLKDNEVLLITNDDNEKQALQKLIENEKKINIEGKNYNIKNNTAIKENDYRLIVILPDYITEKMTKSYAVMHIKENEKNKKQIEDMVKELKEKFRNLDYERDKLLSKYGFIVHANTRIQMYDDIKSTTGTILYIAIYLGFVFLIASAAILAIQQLTEASDSLNRYKALKKIGASDDMINKTIFIQILIHFIAPLSLALIHSLVGIQIMKRLSEYEGGLEIFKLGPTVIVTGVVILIIYGGYFYTTYLGYKNIVKNS